MFPIPSADDLNRLFDQENFDFQFELTSSLILVLIFGLLRYLLSRSLFRRLRHSGVLQPRALSSVKLMRMLMFILFLALLLPIWVSKLESFGVYVVSFLAVLTFAFSANISLLGNVSASLVLFLSYPMRIGSQIQMLDGKDSITGIITDITIFSMLLQTEAGHRASIPNTLAVQRCIVVLEY